MLDKFGLSLQYTHVIFSFEQNMFHFTRSKLVFINNYGCKSLRTSIIANNKRNGTRIIESVFMSCTYHSIQPIFQVVNSFFSIITFTTCIGNFSITMRDFNRNFFHSIVFVLFQHLHLIKIIT